MNPRDPLGVALLLFLFAALVYMGALDVHCNHAARASDRAYTAAVMAANPRSQP
jgi:hypothetical protein